MKIIVNSLFDHEKDRDRICPCLGRTERRPHYNRDSDDGRGLAETNGANPLSQKSEFMKPFEARSSPFDPELRPKILDAAADKETFTALLDDLQKNKSRLDFLNVVTLLHRVGKYRMTLSAEILTYITEQIFLMPVYERLKGQQFGIILYGFQKLGDSPEVRPTALSS